MSAEKVPKYGKADVAFAGAQLGDVWLFLGSLFFALPAGKVMGWFAYIAVPLLGFAATKAFIHWKSKHLPGHLTVVRYRNGMGGYSSAFNRKKKLFMGDSKIVNPGAIYMTALMRVELPILPKALPDLMPAEQEPVQEVEEEFVG